jgi:hypothetical protein
MFSDKNPFMQGVAAAAQMVQQQRQPVSATNPFVAWEKWWAGAILQGFDLARDLRDTFYETAFLSLYGSPVMNRLAESHTFQRTRKDPKELRYLPEVQAILLGLARGGFEEAVIRMLILLAESRGSVRRDRLERSAKVLTKDEPFASLGPDRRAGRRRRPIRSPQPSRRSKWRDAFFACAAPHSDVVLRERGNERRRWQSPHLPLVPAKAGTQGSKMPTPR